MKNNLLPKINLSSAKLASSKFNLSHDVNTSLDWGSLQPLMCREVAPGSKSSFSVESLVRLAPMLRPTFGRMSLKMWHNFVAYADLLPHFFPSFEAQQPISFGTNTYTPSHIPSVDIRLLSSLVLIGAHCSLYSVSEVDASEGQYYRFVDLNDSQAVSMLSSGIGVINSQVNSFFRDDDFPTAIGCFVKPLLNVDGQINGLSIPLNNNAVVRTGTWVNDLRTFQSYDHNAKGVSEPVSIDGADVIIRKQYKAPDDTVYDCAFAFRLSSFGKRLRKILIGLGYQINFGLAENVSLMPLFAWYKSYFDVFGLTLYQGYETTNLAKILSFIEYSNYTDFNDAFTWPESDIGRIFFNFVIDLGNCWYTQDQDYVSAHITSQTVSPRSSLGSQLVDVDVISRYGQTAYEKPVLLDDDDVVGYVNAANSSGSISGNTAAASLSDGSHAAIGSVLHGALDEEYLKRLYVWTNRNTVAGREIEKLLRAQGLGAFVDSTKSHFIGHSSLPVNVSDVTSTAGTFDAAADSGELLGDYAGKGIAMNDDRNPAKNFSYDNDESGLIISMMALVPNSGFVNGIDPQLFALDKFSRYNPEFDGLGFEATKKSVIFGNGDVNVTFRRSPDQSFGFVPRYSGFKVAQNIMNGDFNLRSTRSGYLPYTLDRFVAVNDLVPVETSTDGEHDHGYVVPLDISNVPNATPEYRQVCRYPWLSNFNRIFVNVGLSGNNDRYFWAYFFTHPVAGPLMVNEYDNFICSNIINLVTYEPKLALSDSFETVEDGKRADLSMEKA